MKILQVLYSLELGGAEKFCVELSNEMAKSNEVIICVIKPIEDWMIQPKLISPKVKTILLSFNKKYSFMLFYKLNSIVKREMPDVVHIHSSLLVFYLFIISIFYPNILILQTVHSTFTKGYKKLFSFLSFFNFINPEFFNVCISKEIYSAFSKKYKQLTFAKIDNGVAQLSTTEKFDDVKKELEKLKRTPNTKVFLAVGNYSDLKNYIMLSEVFRELEEMKEDVILIIIGSSRNKNYNKVTQIKSSNTYQLGIKANVSDYMYLADALIISSIQEGMPLVALESLSAGLPIISTPAGGMVDIIKNGVNGFLSDNFTKEELLKNIIYFLECKQDSIIIMKDNAKKSYLEKYSINKCASDYLKLYTRDNE